MKEIAKHIDDIPENIYIQIPLLIYKSWKKEFVDMSKYADRIANYELSISKKGRYIRSTVGYYINEDHSDPFGLTYTIFFRIKIDKFILVLNNFMIDNDILFDYDIFYDKNKLLDYVSRELSKMFKRKFYIKIDIPYVVFILETTLKTKGDIIDM